MNDQLQEKVTDIFSQLNISISTYDIEDCHWLDKTQLLGLPIESSTKMP